MHIERLLWWRVMGVLSWDTVAYESLTEKAISMIGPIVTMMKTILAAKSYQVLRVYQEITICFSEIISFDSYTL